MKKLETKERLSIAGGVVVIMVCVAFIAMSWFGLEITLSGVGICLLIETIIAVANIIKPEKESTICLWIGCAFHIIGFIVVWAIAISFGWWGEPFEWEAERGHGVFTHEVSPAYLWNIFLYLAVARLVLQPIYLLVLKIKRR